MAKLQWAIKPYPLQQEIIDYLDGKKLNPYGQEYRFFVAALGRQVGKSWLAKYILLEYSGNRAATCMWVAPTIPTARGHWNNLVKLIKDAKLVENGVVVKVVQHSKEIIFKNGGSITVRSAVEPDNLRGASLDLLILDEAAFFRDGDYVWNSVCLPMITATGGKVLFTTTPNGRNWLYKLYKRGTRADDKYYVSWNFPSHISPYQDKELLADLKKTMPSLNWREEFLAEFIPDGGGVFAGLERAATVEMIHKPITNHEYVMGIDVGFNHDKTCISVIDVTAREQVWGKGFTAIGTIPTVKNMLLAIEHWKPKQIYIEKNGVGESFVDLLRTALSGGNIEDIIVTLNNDDSGETKIEQIGEYQLIALHMDNSLKRNLVERLAADIEYDRFKILKDEEGYGEMQINEMSTFARKPTSSGMGITYQASDDNEHDDSVVALYVAYKGVPMYFRSHRLSTHKRKTSSPFKNRTGGGLRSKGKRNHA